MSEDGRGQDRIVPVTEEPAGDDACWLGELCPECGAVPEGADAEDPAGPCWRCGAARADDSTGGDPRPGGGSASGEDAATGT